jgi:hypothetical protein
VEQRYGRFVGLELRDAAGALREVIFELGVLVGWQLVLEIIREQPDDVGARAVMVFQ